MLIRKIFFILSLFIAQIILGKECVVGENQLYDCNPMISSFVDINETYSNNYLPTFNSFTNEGKVFFGHLQYPIWTKLNIQYISKSSKNIILYNPKIAVDYIDVFIYENNKLIQKHTLGDMIEPTNKELSSRYSAFELQLTPNNSYQIISHIKHKGALDIRWNIKKPFDFYTSMTQESVIIGLLVGLLIAVFFYTFLLYRATADAIYLFYSLHIFFMFLYQIANTNILYQFHIILGGYFIWIIAFLSFAMLLLFGRIFTNIQTTNPLINQYFRITIFLFIIGAFYFFLASFFNDLMIYRKMIILFGFIFIIPSIILLVFVTFKNKIDGAIYYTIGHFGYLLCILYPHLENILAEHLILNGFYVSVGGILFDVIFLSIALSKKIAFLHNENLAKQDLLIAQASFTNIGKTLSNISHQYKTPLAHLSLLITSLEAHLFKTNNSDSLLKDIASKMRKSLVFMNDTMNNFNSFYSNSKGKEEFSIGTEIQHIREMFQDKISILNVKVDYDETQPYKMFGYKNAFDNVLVILFENALEIFEQRNIENPLIKIMVENKNDIYVISIEDNGGGIKLEPIDDIFKTFISSKTKSNGLGLSMCKILVENRLSGKIEAYNSSYGACFQIQLFANSQSLKT